VRRSLPPAAARSAGVAILLALTPLGLQAAAALDSWTRREPDVRHGFSALTWDADARRFLAVDEPVPSSGSPEPSTLLTSADGTLWTRLPTASRALATGNLAAGGGRMQAVSYSHYPVPLGEWLESTNGVDWQARSNLEAIPRSVDRENGQFIATGWARPDISICDPLFPCPDPELIAWFDGRPVGVTIPRNAGVPDTTLTIARTDVAYGDGRWIVAAWVTWNNPFSPFGSPLTVLHSWTSTDGTNFLRSPALRSFYDFGPASQDKFRVRVQHGNGRFLLVSGEDRVRVSTDGLNWEAGPSIGNGPLVDLAFGGGRFVAVGAMGTALSSQNGLDWTTHSLGNGVTLRAIEYGAHRFVAFAGTNAVYQSAPIVTTRLQLAAAQGSPQLEISAPTGTRCRVETTATPELPDSWQPAATLDVTSDPMVWTDPQPGPDRKFYRVALLEGGTSP
jgi:hypothetical protein